MNPFYPEFDLSTNSIETFEYGGIDFENIDLLVWER
jgi:hypothetical protein